MEVYSIGRFAATLRMNGFSDGKPRVMSPSSDGAITVNLTALSAQEQGMARAALQEWQTIANLRFVETTGKAQITYDSPAGDRATTSTTYNGDGIISARVSIGDDRVNPGDTIGSFVFRSYMHETAHALGLGHPQDYGAVATFGQSAIANDSWQMSLLSYFDQIENTWVNASKAYNLTPMVADYVAMRAAYGGVAVRTGDTVYGVGSTAGGTLDKAAALGSKVAFLVADSGGTDTISFAGFTQAQRIDLRPGTISNVMGGTGNMQIAPDTVIENATGGRGNDMLIGNGAANRLVGGGGGDRLQGLGGNDTYVVDGADIVLEGVNGGIDTVLSTVNYALTANVENLVLAGNAVNGTGNGLANRVTGTVGNNRLDGGGGRDTLAGGAGDDAYIYRAGAVIVEGAGRGTDTVHATANYALAANIENLVLTGSVVNGIGNALSNRIYGNAAANRLDGREGADILVGGAGSDTLTGGTGRDRLEGGADGDLYITEGADLIVEAVTGGYDTVISTGGYALAANVEQLIIGGSLAAWGVGNGGDNRLRGNDAANALNGAGGNDMLFGGGGADRFVFDAGFDRIMDFTDDVDQILFRSSALGGVDYQQVMAAAQDTADGVLFTLGAHRLLVEGTTIDALRDDVVIG